MPAAILGVLLSDLNLTRKWVREHTPVIPVFKRPRQGD